MARPEIVKVTNLPWVAAPQDGEEVSGPLRDERIRFYKGQQRVSDSSDLADIHNELPSINPFLH